MNRRILLALSCALPLLACTGNLAAQTLVFTEIEAEIQGGNHCNNRWGDIDNDGDLDIVVAGGTGSGGVGARIYRNEAGEFIDIEAPLAGVTYCQCTWADYDNDGDIDLLLAGLGESYREMYLYRNDDGFFVDSGIELVALRSPALTWGDADNDGDLDLFLSGNYAPYSNVARLYINNGGFFSNTFNSDFKPVASGSASWLDFDCDGDMDIFSTGTPLGPLPFVTEFYLNINGDFHLHETDITAVSSGWDEWGDIDGDGDLDLLLLGSDEESVNTSLYENDKGRFLEVPNSFIDLSTGSGDFADIDNDGDLDALLTGGYPYTEKATLIYINVGGAFIESGVELLPVAAGMAVWGDYDADSDLDIFLMGINYDVVPVTRIYRNDSGLYNTPPEAPGNLHATEIEDGVLLEWDRASDAETPQLSLSYNLRVGTTPGGVEIMSPMADPLTGRRLIVEQGNTNTLNRWELRGLPAGSYTWSVQSIDGAYAASAFAAEQGFSIGLTGAPDGAPAAQLRLSNHPNPFNPRTEILLDLPEAGRVDLSVFDAGGRLVHRLLKRESLAAGRHRIAWDGRDDAGRSLPGGVYPYRAVCGGAGASARMLLLK